MDAISLQLLTSCLLVVGTVSIALAIFAFVTYVWFCIVDVIAAIANRQRDIGRREADAQWQKHLGGKLDAVVRELRARRCGDTAECATSSDADKK